ncbi:sulfurtransferase [Reinekea marinisedimentorum]|uniref:Thiosulfate/3-mercaptopyruvate sulfurtransferase n=1 Tax=Reinekea marinisedimentorum TaxID=230495 RepID=A0A4V2UJH4_9GAMM|nr:sulfurtransferase [Reinekea marinisedimentorum]TCS40152.1 thiosulfate/3-mercaptopyruvate sulfurtransferase [Reinekea marinisedimentorum]
MSHLIRPNELHNLIKTAEPIILDCQANLTDRTKSQQMYQSEHIPGAYHADTETDLSSEIIPGKTGRHPMPSIEQWQQRLQKWGITQQSEIILYDQSNSMFASRAWWLLQWAGITHVRVLDGGLAAWKSYGGETTSKIPELPAPSTLTIRVQQDWLISADELLPLAENSLLLDARALPRYKGAEEPLDTKAGHIPGAINADFTRNLDVDHRFLSRTQLKQRFKSLQNQDAVCYCGSGITACHNILAIAESGLPMPKLYAGSWSEWIVDDSRPIATGIEGEPL